MLGACSNDTPSPAATTTTTAESVTAPEVTVLDVPDTSDAAAVINPETIEGVPGGAGDLEGEIKALYESFYDTRGTWTSEDRIANLDNGPALAGAIESMRTFEVEGLYSQVSSVEVLSPELCEPHVDHPTRCARVTHRFFAGEQHATPVLEHYAIHVAGAWKVAHQSFCEVVFAGGGSCTPAA